MQTIKKNYVNQIYRDNLYLNILDREMPNNSNNFFKTLISEPFELNISIKRENAFEDIKYHLSKQLLKRVKDHIFYYKWIKDMSEICILYFNIIKKRLRLLFIIIIEIKK